MNIELTTIRSEAETYVFGRELTDAERRLVSRHSELEHEFENKTITAEEYVADPSYNAFFDLARSLGFDNWDLALNVIALLTTPDSWRDEVGHAVEYLTAMERVAIYRNEDASQAAAAIDELLAA